MAVGTRGGGKVLVTGAVGFIGRALCERLSAAGVPCVAAVRRLPAGSAPGSGIVALGDFAAADWSRALSGVSVVVHLAGRAQAPRGHAVDPETAYLVANVHVTRRLADAAAQAGVQRMVFASTVKVYGESTRPGRAFRAGDPARPQDAYARSKAEAENALWDVCQARGVEGVVLRLPLTYGPGVAGNFRRLLQAIARGQRLPLAGIGNRRSLLYVGNAASAFEAALAAPALAGETLPVADAESVSTTDLVLRIGAALGTPVRLFRVPRAVLRAGATIVGHAAMAERLLQSLEVDATRFRELSGWSPSVTLDAGLAATAAWYRAMRSL